MIEVGLMTKCSEHVRAWKELLQRVWPFVVQNSQDLFDQNNLSAEDVENMDDGI